ncbi:MAG: tRNA dimethylallyltransferase [Bacteroidales bacterium]|nr:tRNA dimethylallyltransferase [Bacteroidales bacterium]
MPRVKNLLAELPSAEVIDLEAIRAGLASGEIELVCVLGPTASGKTRYAVQLARALGGEIISADSRQVYRGMDIGTGKDLADYGEVPYHLIDIANPGDGYNVFRFKEDFGKAYAGIRSRGATPILCGGTGLYINAVTSGYDFKSHKPLSAPKDNGGEGLFFQQTETAHGHPEGQVSLGGQQGDNLSRRDGGDPLAGGMERSGSFLEEESLPAVPRTFFIGTLVTREVRNARIDARLDARLQEGMIDEIKGLLNGGVAPSVLLAYGLEYKYVTLYLLGELDYASMREKLATAIHQFAKRQMTWFRGMERSGTVIHWTEVS